MDRTTFCRIESYMKRCMTDAAHDVQHVYRVLHNALAIAQDEPAVDYDVLITACLLHDIGRQLQLQDPQICHAEAGSRLARQYLLEQGFSPSFAHSVSHCISTHRFRGSNPPETTEAKILFDADKLDAAGTMGIARTLLYGGKQDLPLYSLNPDGSVSDGARDTSGSFFQEYQFKLRRIYDKFYTKKGLALAKERQQSADQFFQAILHETIASHDTRFLDIFLDR